MGPYVVPVRAGWWLWALGVGTAGGHVADPAVTCDGAGAVGCGGDEGQGRLHQQAGPGYGRAGMFFGEPQRFQHHEVVRFNLLSVE